MILQESLDKERIYYELTQINNILKAKQFYLDLKIVGGAALLFNGITAIETVDVDVINQISEEIKEICFDFSLDINDDALDYIHNFDNCEFIEDNHLFSNITISYLTLGSTIKTKLKSCGEEDKLEKLAYLLEDILEVDMTVEGISSYLEELGETPDLFDIENFLMEIGYI